MPVRCPAARAGDAVVLERLAARGTTRPPRPREAEPRLDLGEGTVDRGGARCRQTSCGCQRTTVRTGPALGDGRGGAWLSGMLPAASSTSPTILEPLAEHHEEGPVGHEALDERRPVAGTAAAPRPAPPLSESTVVGTTTPQIVRLEDTWDTASARSSFEARRGGPPPRSLRKPCSRQSGVRCAAFDRCR